MEAYVEASGPLGAYLREAAGETYADVMPGAFEVEEAEDNLDIDEYRQFTDWTLSKLPMIDLLVELLSSRRRSKASEDPPFVERFKYAVVSSTLLADELASHPHPPSASTPVFPGALSISAQSPAPTPDLSTRATPTPASHSRASVPTSLSPRMADYVLLLHALLLASAGYRYGVLADVVLVLLGLAVLMNRLGFLAFGLDSMDDQQEHEQDKTMDALQDLIRSGEAWDVVVQEVIASEDHPSPALGVALASTLHTTQTQCDNVRQLFGALTTNAEEGAQVVGMYAPTPIIASASPSHRSFDLASPTSKRFSFSSSSPTSKRFSMSSSSPTGKLLSPDTGLRPLSLPTPATRPRTSVMSRAEKRATWSGGALRKVDGQKDKRRSGLGFGLVLGSGSGEMSASTSRSAPPSTAGSSAPVTPTRLGEVTEEEPTEEDEDGYGADTFGLAALDVQRQRKRQSQPQSLLSPSATPSHDALYDALQARRYTSAHLLALRFADADSEPGYWEDVRSVMALLSAALGDAAARLREARIQSPRHSDPTSTRYAGGFAPVLSVADRFAMHVRAMEDAIEEARAGVVVLHTHFDVDKQEDVLERVRRELGRALRECERGRGRLEEMRTGGGDGEEEEEEEESAPSATTTDSEPTSIGDEHEHEVEPRVLIVEGAGGGDASREEEVLPMDTVEQVFEGESMPGRSAARTKMRLSREERIAEARAQREEQARMKAQGGGERWDPEGAVVRELKDVIWRVGERRRMLGVSSEPALDVPLPPSPFEDDVPAYQSAVLESESGVLESDSGVLESDDADSEPETEIAYYAEPGEDEDVYDANDASNVYSHPHDDAVYSHPPDDAVYSHPHDDHDPFSDPVHHTGIGIAL